VRTIERRLSAIAWTCAQRGQPLDRADRHIAEVMSGIRRRHARPPDQKEAVLAEDLMRMVETLDHGLRGLRDRAILLIGFAGGLRRSEITGLACGPDQTEEGAGWIEFLPGHPHSRARQNRVARGRDRPRLEANSPARSDKADRPPAAPREDAQPHPVQGRDHRHARQPDRQTLRPPRAGGGNGGASHGGKHESP
jgi:integrase